MSLQVEIEKKLNDKVLSVSFDTEGKQGITGILGASGCGKSMTLKCIAGIETPDRGKIVLNGRVLFDSGKKINLCVQDRHVGYLFQNYALFPNMTVEKNIAAGFQYRPGQKMTAEEIKKQTADYMELLHVTELKSSYPRKLSGGQQQRVALARAIVYNPPLLLLDEPLGALDMNLRHDMQFEIKRITKELGITTISVTHDQEEAFAMSDKICIMSEGRVQQFATPDEIYEHPSNRFVAEFMGTTNIIEMKDITYEDAGEQTKVMGTTNISETPMTLLVDNQYIRKDQTKAIFTLRPESIHLDDGQTEKNKFFVKLDESVYLGDRVKIKASAGDKLLNINLKVGEFRHLENPDKVPFYFRSQDVSIIYE